MGVFDVLVIIGIVNQWLILLIINLMPVTRLKITILTYKTE